MRTHSAIEKTCLVVICSVISVVITCVKGHSIVGTNITYEGKTSQPWTLFWKRFMPKRNFLHKKGFLCIKGLPNVTFYACKRSFNCRYQYLM